MQGDDLLEQLRRVDVSNCRVVAIAGPAERVTMAMAFAQAMAPPHVQVGALTPLEMTDDATAKVTTLLLELGLRNISTAPVKREACGPADVVLFIDGGADEASPTDIAVAVGNPANLAEPLGILPRGPALRPSDPGGDDEAIRWRFAAGWLRDICQALFARSDRGFTDES